MRIKINIITGEIPPIQSDIIFEIPSGSALSEEEIKTIIAKGLVEVELKLIKQLKNYHYLLGDFA